MASVGGNKVDVAREQERRARLQLLDEIREPSPQPIFGEPVKVELEDETSRRIKNTLGDFTQVLINDPKNLIGISRPVPVPGHSSASSSRVQQPTAKRPPQVVNGVYKPNPVGAPTYPKVGPDKRPVYPRNNRVEASKPFYPNSGSTVPYHNQDTRVRDSVAWQDKEPRRTNAVPFNFNNNLSNSANLNNSTNLSNSANLNNSANFNNSANLNTSANFNNSANLNTSANFNNSANLNTSANLNISANLNNSANVTNNNVSTLASCATTSAASAYNKSLPSYGQNGMVSNSMAQVPRYGDSVNNAPPSKRTAFRPGTLKIPEQQPDNNEESPIELETILRVMKQVVPDPPLTAIQTPRPEESGFAFPTEPKEELPFLKEEEQYNLIEPVPQISDDPQPKEISPRQTAPSPYISSSLHEDLEMSDSDEEPVQEVKNTPAGYLKSPVTTTATVNNSSTVAPNNSTNMEVPPAVPAESSSSESGDSDSDDSSSESNDSDSSASSESDDSDTPCNNAPLQMWGLSNFFGETRRNQNPAVYTQCNAKTNSDTAIKEPPLLPPTEEKESFSLVDDESVAGILRGCNDDLKDYLAGSMPNPISDLLELDTPGNIKSDIISPIPSPVHTAPPAPPAPPAPSAPSAPPVVRGPRTPPTPSYSTKEDASEVNGVEIQSENNQEEKSSIDVMQPASQTSQQQVEAVQGRSDVTDDKGKGQGDKCRKQQRVAKSKVEVCSPKIQSSPLVHLDSTEPCASKELPDSSSNKEKEGVPGNNLAPSSSIPSEISESSHENFTMKTPQKPSASSSSSSGRKSKTVSAENNSGNGLKAVPSTKSSAAPKFKHPTRACRISNESKQNKPKVTATGTKIDQNEETKRRSKLELKDSMCNSEKSKEKTAVIKNASKNSSKVKSKVPKPPTKQPPAKQPPAKQPPTKQPPAKQPPTKQPPAKQPPAKQPPAKQPPAKQPPTKQPPTKQPPPEVKKTEAKKKKKKFAIENFLQSPSFSQNESERVSNVPPVFSPSPERSPIPEYKQTVTQPLKRPAPTPSRASKSPGRSSSKNVEKVKNVEKLRRSVRCSERASTIAQAESSSAPRQKTKPNRKISKNAMKVKDKIANLPIRMEPPPQIISPIPQDSPIPSVSECAIPMKIMVSIPLEKLSRLPSVLKAQEAENKQASKARSSLRSAVDEAKKENLPQEKASKSIQNKTIQSKDYKDKPRTVPPLKNNRNNSKNISVNKKEKNSKPLSEPLSASKSNPASSVTSKNSIKVTSDKTICDDSENKLPKKRKSENEENKFSRKKPKISSRVTEERKLKEQSSSLKNDLSNQNEESGKSKTLERCDSASSLSSLCSQQSQRSSKSTKDKLKESGIAADAKRLKTTASPLLSMKDIKQEREDRLKGYVKKEPTVATDKSKTKSREKLASKDNECKDKVCGELWNDTLNSSSQFCHWEIPCKDDSKGQLLGAQSLVDILNRDSGFDWDHFGADMHKELKEASTLNKHSNQAPIMPMDYYWTEGRKQKQLAEKEKDPLLQALKYFEATVLFILTSQQKEECTKDPDAVYQFYEETLKFSAIIRSSVQKLQSCSGSTEFKLLILCLKCQSLLHVKLYNLKIKEIKEQQKGVSDFFRIQCPTAFNNSSRSSAHPSHQLRISSLANVPSPHSPTPSPASSVNSQTSGYSSSDVSGNHMRNSLQLLSSTVNVSQTMLDMICRQHTYLINLHLGHDLWEQADMYMTRSNLREFFKEVADQSEPLTLHSSISELVRFVQKGLSLLKKCPR